MAAAGEEEAKTTTTRKISLKSSDEDIFEVSPLVAKQMETVQAFIEDFDYSSSSSVVIPLPKVNTFELSKTLEYLKFHHREGGERVENDATMDDAEAKKESASFDAEFLKSLEPPQLKQLVFVADYLTATGFLEFLTQGVADLIQNKSVEYVRKFFGLESDFTPDEEEEMRNANAWAFQGVDPDPEDLEDLFRF